MQPQSMHVLFGWTEQPFSKMLGVLLLFCFKFHLGKHRSTSTTATSIAKYPSPRRVVTKTRNHPKPPKTTQNLGFIWIYLDLLHFTGQEFSAAQRERAQEDFKVLFKGAPPHPPSHSHTKDSHHPKRPKTSNKTTQNHLQNQQNQPKRPETSYNIS